MTETNTLNLLNLGVAMAWFSKIIFHFLYLKTLDENIKEQDLISFLRHVKDMEKFRILILLLLPLFFTWKSTEDEKVKRTKVKARLSTWILWIMLTMSSLYIYNHLIIQKTADTEYLLKAPKTTRSIILNDLVGYFILRLQQEINHKCENYHYSLQQV